MASYVDANQDEMKPAHFQSESLPFTSMIGKQNSGEVNVREEIYICFNCDSEKEVSRKVMKDMDEVNLC